MSNRTKMTADDLRNLALEVSKRAEEYAAIASQMDEAGLPEIEARGVGTFAVSMERLDGNINSLETILRQAMRKAKLGKLGSGSTEPPMRKSTPVGRKKRPASPAKGIDQQKRKGG